MNKSTALVVTLLLTCVSAPAFAGTEALMDPAALKEIAPETFQVRFETSAGPFVVEVHREWAPIGADRFYNLVKSGFSDDVRVFRVAPGFVMQFGMSGDPAIGAVWQGARMKDDAVTKSNTRGRITFATSGPDSRTTQVFINLRDNAGLDNQGFSPFGEVIEGMEAVDAFFAGYAKNGPNQGLILNEGNAYLDGRFPELTKITKATIVAAPAK